MKLKSMMAVTGLTLLALIASSPSFARTKAEIDASANSAISRFYALNPQHKDLANKAVGILIFGRVTKGGAGVAGEFGEGALRVRGQNVGYYSLSSASVGLTLGVAKHDEIIMFMTQDALDKFTSTKGWAVGADTGIAMLSKGAGGDYDTKTLQRPILGFVFAEKGLIADVSLDGSKITQLNR
jgi:lipid-binding SYLF domain-containing protein